MTSLGKVASFVRHLKDDPQIVADSDSSWRRFRHEGPPDEQTARAIEALFTRLSPEGYEAGDYLRAWGWLDEATEVTGASDLSYDRLVAILRSANFDISSSQDDRPDHILWVHKLRNAALLHGIYALAAAAITRAGITVELVLDDTTHKPNQRRSAVNAFVGHVNRWFLMAGGDPAKLTTSAYSTILNKPYLREHGWDSVERYLNNGVTVGELLRASKVLSSRERDLEAVNRALSRSESFKLITPLRNWMVFETLTERFLAVRNGTATPPDPAAVSAAEPAAAGEAVDRSEPPPTPPTPLLQSPRTFATLGGVDEQSLWDIWGKGVDDDLGAQVNHVYLSVMPLPPSVDSVWSITEFRAPSSVGQLREYLAAGWTGEDTTRGELIRWLRHTSVDLPAALSPAYSAELPPTLRHSAAANTRMEADVVIDDLAQGIVSWLAAEPTGLEAEPR